MKFNEREDIHMGKSVGSYFWRTKKEILLTTKFENVTIIL